MKRNPLSLFVGTIVLCKYHLKVLRHSFLTFSLCIRPTPLRVFIAQSRLSNKNSKFQIALMKSNLAFPSSFHFLFKQYCSLSILPLFAMLLMCGNMCASTPFCNLFSKNGIQFSKSCIGFSKVFY